ncbi:MAG TPA: flagellar hook-length control protein FliK [Rhizomicrobium sp.]|nr:flagellar hook-length control protein FliK [Rhizomicrobium sp.]
MASAAASVIVAGTAATQTQDSGRAKQTGADPSGGGGLFSDLLAELLQDVQASGSSQDAAAQLSADLAQQGVQVPSGPANQTPGANADAQQPPDGQTDTTQSGWLAAWTAALAQQMQQTQQSQPPGQSTGTSPLDALVQLLEQQSGGQAPTDSQPSGSTQDSQTPTQDASLLAALQSLAAQFGPSQTSQQPQLASKSSSQGTDPLSATTPSAPSNAELIALLQTLKADIDAMTGAQSDTPSADTQTTAHTQQASQMAQPVDATVTSSQSNTAPKSPASFTQTAQQALRQGPTAPATQAQSLPVHFNSDAGSSDSAPQNQTGQHGSNANANADASANAQTQDPSKPADAASGSTNLPTFLQVAHDQALSQQNVAASNAAQNNAVNAIGGVTAQQAPAQTTGATLQVVPAASPSNSTPDVHALAVNIAAQSQAGAKQFDIRLDPPELGRVDVRLTVDASGKAQAHLAVDKPQTLELLQKDSGSLARALRDSGVQLSNNGLQFSLKGQGRNGDGSRGSTPRGRSLSVTAIASTAPPPAASSSAYSVSASGVDIRV